MTDRLVETHCSTLLLLDDVVYKRKKPLDLGFADFRSLASRRAACEAEVALNRRLAPDVYRGVATVLGPDGAPCEALVVMARMPDERQLSHLVRTGHELGSALDQIAAQLAALHRRSPAPPQLADSSSRAALLHLWDTGLDALVGFSHLVPEGLRERCRELAARYLTGRGRLLEHRRREGRTVDGHGDLLCDDVYVLEDGPRLLDCLEFDERLRVGDGLLDAAFLAMDLERLGRADLGARFLRAYRSAAAEDAPSSLEHHFLAYRAHIRCKVACIRAAQTGADEGGAAAALAALSFAHLDAARVRLVLVGGAPGSGKSTLAERLAARLDGAVLSSDRVRKSLCGLSPTTPAPSSFGTGIYAPALTDATYQALAEQARESLEMGSSVVVDATFTRAAHRLLLRTVAAEAFADITELQCVVSDELALTRLAARTHNPSDATAAVRRELLARTDPWPEAQELDGTAALTELVHQAVVSCSR